MGKIIDSGAEAIISFDEENDAIIKERIRKSYRIDEIDEPLRKFRTKREAKVLEKLEKAGFDAPKIVKKSEFVIEMENIEGKKLRDILNKDINKKNDIHKKDCEKLCRELGFKIGVLHNDGIIHGDLTTSNFILNEQNGRIYFIDFGLSFFSHKIEDKAVDLHLLREALISKHNEIWEESYDAALQGYKEAANDFENVFKRLEVVESRGRYKGKSKKK